MKLKISTHQKDEVIAITDEIEDMLAEQKLEDGVCVLFVQHTTCCLTTADLDPGTDEDMLNALREIAPKLNYRHPHDPSHAPDHILSSLIGPSLSLPFEGKKLQLGTWQEVVLVEFDGPRERSIFISILSTA